MEKNKSRIPSPADYAAYGLRVGAFLVGMAAVIALAVFVWNICRTRTGLPGWELVTVPAAITCFYIGWTAGENHARKRRAEARRKRREKAKCHAAGRSELLEARDEASNLLGRELTDFEWNRSLEPALRKLDRIIALYGDDSGKRRKPYYLGVLVQEHIIFDTMSDYFTGMAQKKTASEEDGLPINDNYTIFTPECQSRKETRQ